MKKLTFIILSLLFVSFSFSQETVAPKQQKANLKTAQVANIDALFTHNPDVKIFKENFEKQGYTSGSFVQDGTISLEGKDESGPVNISLITYSLANPTKKGQPVYVVMLSNNVTGEKIVIAEDATRTYEIRNNDVAVRGATSKSVGTCWEQYKTGVSDCTSCYNCITNCLSKNKKWQKVYCLSKNCVNPCWSCLKSIWGFFSCLFQ